MRERGRKKREKDREREKKRERVKERERAGHIKYHSTSIILRLP